MAGCQDGRLCSPDPPVAGHAGAGWSGLVPAVRGEEPSRHRPALRVVVRLAEVLPVTQPVLPHTVARLAVAHWSLFSLLTAVRHERSVAHKQATSYKRPTSGKQWFEFVLGWSGRLSSRNVMTVSVRACQRGDNAEAATTRTPGNDTL